MPGSPGTPSSPSLPFCATTTGADHVEAVMGVAGVVVLNVYAVRYVGVVLLAGFERVQPAGGVSESVLNVYDPPLGAVGGVLVCL